MAARRDRRRDAARRTRPGCALRSTRCSRMPCSTPTTYARDRARRARGEQKSRRSRSPMTGTGIAAESLDARLRAICAAPTRRARAARAAPASGLSIVAAIARAHGGSCTARSVDGEGAVFELRLPLTSAGAPTRSSSRRRISAPKRSRSSRPDLLESTVTALYRKYRPQTFEEVVGQEAVVRTLTNAIEQGKIRQAYLFAGPRGTGKTSLARILAKAVNCAHGPTRTPTTPATPASRSRTARSLDVIEMDAASQRGIDDIREIRERVVLQPVEGTLQGLHPRRGAPAHRRRLERAPEADRGAAAPPALHLLHDRAAEGAADRALALPDVRLPAAAAARARAQAAPDRRRRADRRARRGARADRARRPRRLPRRRVDARPARVGDRRHDHGAGRAAAARRGRGRGALPALRHVVDGDTAGRADLPRGALGAGAGSRPARHRPARAPAPPAARPAHGRGARHAARDRRGARAAARAGEPAAARRPSSG